MWHLILRLLSWWQMEQRSTEALYIFILHHNILRAVSVHDQRPVGPAAAVNKKPRSNKDQTSRVHYQQTKVFFGFLYPSSRPFDHYELRVHRHSTGLRRQYAFLGGTYLNAIIGHQKISLLLALNRKEGCHTRIHQTSKQPDASLPFSS